MFITTLFTSVAQLFYKQGASYLSFDLMALITNYHIIIGMVLYIFGAAIFIVALRHGEVSVLYPIIATSYIWVTIFAGILFNEQINYLRWIGVSIIILGIIFIGLGSKDGAMAYAEGV